MSNSSVPEIRLTRDHIRQDVLHAEAHTDCVKLWVTSYDDSAGAFMLLERDRVEALHAFLGEWLAGALKDHDHA